MAVDADAIPAARRDRLVVGYAVLIHAADPVAFLPYQPRRLAVAPTA